MHKYKKDYISNPHPWLTPGTALRAVGWGIKAKILTFDRPMIIPITISHTAYIAYDKENKEYFSISNKQFKSQWFT